jgi:poly(3-hydroxybutyrate) depolymerase
MALRRTSQSLARFSTQLGFAGAGALVFALAGGATSGCAVEGEPDDEETGGTAGQGAAGGTGGQGGSAMAGQGGSATGGSGGKGGTGGTGGSGGTGGTTTGGQGGGGGAGSGGAAGAGQAGMGGATGGAGSGGSDDGGMSGGGGSPGGMGGQSAGAGGKAGAGGASGSGGSGGGTSSATSAGCGKAPGIAANMYNNGNPISIMAANKQRRYILSVPANYDNTKPYNLVIAWHQLDGNDKQMYQQNFYWLKDIAEAASSTIFVAPNGEKNGTPCTGMNVAESGCGWPDSQGSNVALADAVVAQVEENFCIDKNRIFANGWSYGGSMSYRTACSRPLGGAMASWGVRGVAVYNGAAQLSSGGCTPSKSVGFYASHGTNDNVLQYSGGVSMANTYANVNGCTAMMPTQASGNHVCTKYMGCDPGYPVEFCSFVGQHTPDPPREGGQRWQPQEVWAFFTALD